MTSKAVTVLAAVLLVAAAMMGGGAGVAAAAQQCNSTELEVCVPAIVGGAAPTASCCASLRSQEPCFCQYVHNPAYNPYINSPNARKTLTSCGIAMPHC